MTSAICFLAMGFIAPGLMWAGMLLVSVPIIIHLLNRRRYRVVQWAAMEYLLKAMKKNRRRLRFESLLLLLTRCALVLLLGLALSRPFGCQDNSLAALAGRKSGLHVFVIDNGYSMSYEADRPSAATHLDQAKLMAKELIDRLSAGSEAVTVLTTAAGQIDPATAMPSPTYDLEAAKGMVDRITQSYGESDMAGALDRARKIAGAAAELPTRTLYIFDDSSRHVWSADQLQRIGPELAEAFHGGIIHYNLGLPNEYNAQVADLSAQQRLTTLVTDFAPSYSADLRAFGQGPPSQLVWKIDGTAVESAGESNLHLDPAGRQAALGRAIFPGGGPRVIGASLVTGDKLACDDTRWRVVNVAANLSMLIVEGERQVGAAGGSGMYLRSALEPDFNGAGATAIKHPLVNIDTISDLELGTRPLGEYRCVALCGAGDITDAAASRLQSFVSDGGALWIFVGSQTTAENYNATLLKHHLLPGPLVQRIVVPASLPDGLKFDFDPSRPVHPLLAPFYQAQDSGLENGRVYSYWQVDIPADSAVERVLNYQSLPGSTRKDPAFTVQTLGLGRIVFCSTTADANEDWTAFPAKKAFPEVMLCLFLGTVSTDESWMNLQVGDEIHPPSEIKMSAAPVLHDPGGEELAINEYTTSDGSFAYRSVPLSRPGVYHLTIGADSYPIAVNVPSDEGDVRLVDSEGIRRALGGIEMTFEQDTVPQELAQADQGRDFGWPILAVVLGMLGFESFMAMKFGRYKRK